MSYSTTTARLVLAAHVRLALGAEAVVRVRRLAVARGVVIAPKGLAGTRMLPREAAVLRETLRARALAGPGRRAAFARLPGTDTTVFRGLAFPRWVVPPDETIADARVRPGAPAFVGSARQSSAAALTCAIRPPSLTVTFNSLQTPSIWSLSVAISSRLGAMSDVCESIMTSGVRH